MKTEWSGRRQSVRYPIAGALLAGGAPLGLLFLRRFILGSRIPLRREISGDLATYLYLTITTTLAFASFGRVLGRHADRLTALSTTDPLTGLLNPRAFYPRLEQELERSRRTGTPMSLVLIDLDGLKAVNDTLGHSAGDRALQRLARAVRQEMRTIDVGARLGGDEFVVLAVGATPAAGEALAERLRTAIAATSEPGLSTTASLGIVTFDPSRDRFVDSRTLMRGVDAALYEAKRAGRNRVALGCLEQLTAPQA